MDNNTNETQLLETHTKYGQWWINEESLSSSKKGNKIKLYKICRERHNIIRNYLWTRNLALYKLIEKQRRRKKVKQIPYKTLELQPY